MTARPTLPRSARSRSAATAATLISMQATGWGVRLALSGLVATTACETSSGSFGDPAPASPGVRVKEVKNNPDAPPDFARAFVLEPRFERQNATLTVTLRLAAGFHAYAAGEEVGRPIQLQVDEATGWRIQSLNLPAGREKDLGDLGKSFVLEGEVPLQATLQGEGAEVRGEVTLQVCTDKACDRPRTHAFRVDG